MKMTDVAVGNLCQKIDGSIHRLDHRGHSNVTALTIDGGGFQKMIAFGFAQRDGSYIWQWIAQNFLVHFPKST